MVREQRGLPSLGIEKKKKIKKKVLFIVPNPHALDYTEHWCAGPEPNSIFNYQDPILQQNGSRHTVNVPGFK